MRIWTSFLIILIDMILWFLPYTQAIYDFRTDIQTDNFNEYATSENVTSGNVTLSKAIFNNDIQTIDIVSDLYTDDAYAYSYNGSSRFLVIYGLSDNTTRDLEVSYDTPSFSESGAIAFFADKIPWFWMTVIVLFPLAALVYIWWGKLTGGE